MGDVVRVPGPPGRNRRRARQDSRWYNEGRGVYGLRRSKAVLRRIQGNDGWVTTILVFLFIEVNTHFAGRRCFVTGGIFSCHGWVNAGIAQAESCPTAGKDVDKKVLISAI